jgi:signal transduction histidine kinase
MDQAAKAGRDITRKLIGYARKGKYHVQPILLNPLVSECAALVSRTRINVIVRTELSDDLGSFSGDRDQIEQVLLNLFVNAVEAMPRGGQLLVRTRNAPAAAAEQRVDRPPPKDHVLLEVSDTGVGMEPDTLKRIFDPFFTTKDLGRGTGLGLASVQGIIKNHNGSIEVSSKKGAGTTFRVFFPAA